MDIRDLEDKREITGLLGISMAGEMLPPQIIYPGKTDRCHAAVSFPEEWNITPTTNHWSNENSMLEYATKVLIPFFKSVVKRLGLDESQKSLLIQDVFAVYRTEKYLSILKETNICIIFVPGGCTGELQPLDVAFNGDFKTSMKGKFSEWYSSQVAAQLAA